MNIEELLELLEGDFVHMVDEQAKEEMYQRAQWSEMSGDVVDAPDRDVWYRGYVKRAAGDIYIDSDDIRGIIPRGVRIGDLEGIEAVLAGWDDTDDWTDEDYAVRINEAVQARVLDTLV